MAAVSINTPHGGSDVPRRFTAKGTFSPYAEADPKPTVHLDNANGVVAQGAVKTNGVGEWEARFALTANYTGLNLIAELPTANCLVVDIDIIN